MLKEPKYGWTKITIGDWEDRCSDISGDVPYFLLEAVDYTNRTYRPSTIEIDAEGWEYVIVFDTEYTHIITCDFDGNWQYTTVEISIKKLAKELLTDIRNYIDGWSRWGDPITEDEIKERKLDLTAWCDIIEKRL